MTDSNGTRVTCKNVLNVQTVSVGDLQALVNELQQRAQACDELDTEHRDNASAARDDNDYVLEATHMRIARSFEGKANGFAASAAMLQELIEGAQQ